MNYQRNLIFVAYCTFFIIFMINESYAQPVPDGDIHDVPCVLGKHTATTAVDAEGAAKEAQKNHNNRIYCSDWLDDQIDEISCCMTTTYNSNTTLYTSTVTCTMSEVCKARTGSIVVTSMV